MVPSILPRSKFSKTGTDQDNQIYDGNVQTLVEENSVMSPQKFPCDRVKRVKGGTEAVTDGVAEQRR